MKHLIKNFLFVFLTLLLSFVSKSQDYKWVKGGGSNYAMAVGDKDEAAYKMCTDAHGNVYALNIIGANAVYADTFTHSAAYWSPANILFTSYNCDGQMRFAKFITGSYLAVQGIVADSFGNLYLAMDLPHSVSGTSVLHIGNDVTIASNPYNRQALVKYDTSGNFKWVRFLGNNTSISYASGAGGPNQYLALDSEQNPHLILNTYGGLVLRPGDTSKYGCTDVRFDTAGNMITVKHLNFDTTLSIYGVNIDKSSNKLYVFGSRNPAFSSLSNHFFLAGFDTDRNLIWKDTLSSTLSTPFPGYFTGVVSDGYGHLYVAGGTSTGMTIYRSDTVVSTLSSYLSFIMKADTAGSPQWITSYSGSVYNGLSGIGMIPNNKIAATGSFLGKVRCDIDSIISYASEAYNPFFTVVDTAGYVHELQQIHGTGSQDNSNSVVSDRVGSLYIGGQDEASVWGGTITPYASVGGDSDFFIMKYGVDCSCTSMPVANFVSVVATPTVNFTYTGTPGDSVRWYFGDGTTSTSLNPTHIYVTPGSFTVRCWVYTSCGRDMKGAKVVIPCISTPVATFVAAGTSATRNFTFTGSAPGLTSLTWDYGDGSGTGSGPTTSHTYGSTGIFTVCVTATSPCGSTVVCTTVNVTCVVAPTASYTKSGSMATRSFTYTGTLSGVDSVAWDYGDGGHATGTPATHTYVTTGIFTVCVTAYSQCGNSTWCDTVNVPCLAVPSVTFSNTGTIHDSTKGFTYTGSMSGVDSVRWDFGDGNDTTGVTVTHSYADTGVYTVCAIAYSQCGNDTTCSTIIYRLPVGLTAVTATDILVYPNPADDELVVEHAGNCEMKVCDVVGREVYSAFISSAIQTFDISRLEGGVYVVQFINGVGVRKVKVVKR